MQNTHCAGTPQELEACASGETAETPTTENGSAGSGEVDSKVTCMHVH